MAIGFTQDKEKIDIMQSIGETMTNAVNAIETTKNGPYEFIVIVKKKGMYVSSIKMGSKKEITKILRETFPG